MDGGHTNFRNGQPTCVASRRLVMVAIEAAYDEVLE